MIRHPEYQYLNTLQDILDNGTQVSNRTGVDTIRILGVTHRYDFSKGFPLFTTKKVWMKGIIHELLWFLSGSENIKYLVDNNVNIWNDDAYRRYKASNATINKWTEINNKKFNCNIPLTPLLSKNKYIENIKNGENSSGNLGPVYGSQWRKWASYEDKKNALGVYELKLVEIDQIANLIYSLKNNPSSRRHILTAWNIAELDRMCLAPCHLMSQYTIDNGKLWCHMYQRSCDMMLGVPFNVASYSLLTYLLAQVCNLEPGGFIWTGHDVHIYESHIDAVKEQISREPKPFCDLLLSKSIKNIDDFTAKDITIKNYKHHPAIKATLHVG